MLSIDDKNTLDDIFEKYHIMGNLREGLPKIGSSINRRQFYKIIGIHDIFLSVFATYYSQPNCYYFSDEQVLVYLCCFYNQLYTEIKSKESEIDPLKGFGTFFKDIEQEAEDYKSLLYFGD